MHLFDASLIGQRCTVETEGEYLTGELLVPEWNLHEWFIGVRDEHDAVGSMPFSDVIAVYLGEYQPPHDGGGPGDPEIICEFCYDEECDAA